ncbi:MAG: glycosyltransferase family 2 protein [Ferruginibacter sp.]
MNKTFIIIPAYNETEVIASTIRPLLERGYEVVVVDDGSSNNMQEHIKQLNVHYLRHEINLGQGAALQTGMEYVKKFNPEYVVHFDADGQHSSDDIDEFINILIEKKTDIVLGSRFLTNETKELVPLKRRLLLKTARILNWIFTGLLLTDAHNGFRVMKGTVLSKLRLTETRMAHATEILRLIKKNRLSYTEAPAKISYTAYSMQKGQKASNSVNILIDLVFHRFI